MTGENRKKVHLILDYDGTIHDTLAVYEPAFRKVMDEITACGWIAPAEYSSEEIASWIGYTAKEMWEKFHPELSEEQRQTAGKQIGRYVQEAVAEGRGRLYPGAVETLEVLKEKYILIFLSNCSREYADNHKKAFGLDRYFSAFYCAGDYGFQQKETVFSQYIYQPGEKYIAIGDRIKDMNLAKDCGLKSIGCLYGFGSEEELRPADKLIWNISELPAAVDLLSQDL